MKIRCVSCGIDHNMTPTHMRLALIAFQNGDAQNVTRGGVTSICLATARLNGLIEEEDEHATDAA